MIQKGIEGGIEIDMEPLSDRQESHKIPIPEIRSLAVPYLALPMNHARE